MFIYTTYVAMTVKLLQVQYVCLWIALEFVLGDDFPETLALEGSKL